MVHRLLVSVAALSLLAACADFPASAQTISPAQRSRVDATCTGVMGLRQGESYWANCEDSLSNSLALRSRALSTEKSYDACRKSGVAEGSPAFATCVLDKEDAVQTGAEQLDSQAMDAPQTVKPAYASNVRTKNYYDMTPTEHWRQEQYSCAQLGFVPYQGDFSHCVASLDAALFPDPN